VDEARSWAKSEKIDMPSPTLMGVVVLNPSNASKLHRLSVLVLVVSAWWEK
jgi:hypothetical protein